MSFLKKLFGTKNSQLAISTYAEFWNWFLKEEKMLFNSLNTQKDTEANLDKILSKLHQLNPELFALMGMYDNSTAELIITPDGDIKNIVFAEDIVLAAPVIKGWKITALKPAIFSDKLSIGMYNMKFNAEKLGFFATQDAATPDEIEIHMVHQDYTKEKHKEIATGSLIFLDNAVGEIVTATQIDNIVFVAPNKAYDLIPIEKLKDYLLWREKEFIEKYEYTKYEDAESEYAIMEATDNNDMPLIATINQDLLSWDAKASHPWMLAIDIAYEGNSTGMPDEATQDTMYKIEDLITGKLKTSEGYLYLGRETYNNERSIFFACKEFRQCSRIINDLIKNEGQELKLSYSIYKDKYWKTMSRYS